MAGLKRRVHFVGVGGIGMSGLAEILLNLDYEVTGSDLRRSEITERLEGLGLGFFEGHDAAHVEGVSIVVTSAAVTHENPEVVAAKLSGIPTIHRSDLLADLIRLKPHAVVVGGSHGKTTTTSMISAMLDSAHLGVTSIVGGILHRSGTNARWGTGEFIVAEADEHDGSFLRLHPTISVVTNVDAEHLEYYGTIDRIKRAFVDFSNGVPFYGYSILCSDDVHTREILDEIESVCITYGLSEGASLRGSNVRVEGGEARVSRLPELVTSIDVACTDERLHPVGPLGTIEVHALGEDNARNALAACAVGLCLGLDFATIQEGLLEFSGVRRRLQFRGEVRGVAVVEDYAHHPTEIRSALEAISWASPSRVVCVFQPHLYSRTKFFSSEFAEVLSGCDRAVVTGIYGSREAPMAGVDAGLIVEAARSAGATHVDLVNDLDEVPEVLAPELEEGDVVLVLGAGDIDRIIDPLLAALKERK